MEKKKAVARKRSYKKRVSRTENSPMPTPEPIYVRGPGKVERTLMCIETILKLLLRFVEKRIQSFKVKRLADKMDEGGPNRI